MRSRGVIYQVPLTYRSEPLEEASDSLIGTIHEFKILKYNKRRSNIVLSRRAREVD